MSDRPESVGDTMDPESLIDHALEIYAEFQSSGDIFDLERALEAFRHAVLLIPDNDRFAYDARNNLAILLREALELTGDPSLLTEAVAAGRMALRSPAPDGHQRAVNLVGHVVSLISLAEQGADPGLLFEALDRAREAAFVLQDDPDTAGPVWHLYAQVARAVYDEVGDLEALPETVVAERAAADSFPEHSPERGQALVGLGYGLMQQGARAGDADLLAEAGQAFRTAMLLTAEEDFEQLTELTVHLLALYQHARAPEFLHAAVTSGRAALALLPPDDNRIVLARANLGGVLRELFSLREDSNVLAEALDLLRANIAEMGTDHPDRLIALANLGVTLSSAFLSTRDAALVHEAIRTLRAAAAQASPVTTPSLGNVQEMLSAALSMLAYRTQDEAPLAEAMKVAEDSVRNTSPDDPALFGRRMALVFATGLLGRARRDVDLLAQAAARQRELMATLAPGRADFGVYECQLGQILLEIHEINGDPGPVIEALALYQSAAKRPGTSLELRIRAYYGIARWGHLTGVSLAEAFAAIEEAVALLPHIVRSELGREDRARLLGDLAALPELVASAGVRAGRPERAVELLERTRGVLFAERLAPTAQPDPEQSGAEIEGPVVAVYVTEAGGGALIVGGGKVQPVALPALTQTEAFGRLNTLIEARRAAVDADADPFTRIQSQNRVFEVLGWMWDAIAGPVLDALGHTRRPVEDVEGGEDEAWPRLWWCPVGILAFLPLHAAGHHEDCDAQDERVRADPRTVLDRVIPSYAATIRGLEYARAHGHPADAVRSVVVAVPDAPDAPPLHGVHAEVAALTALLPDALLLGHPVRAEVLAALPHATLAHFACHGVYDAEDPAASNLVLYDHATDPLTVADITQLRLAGGLAYLSACDTGLTSVVLTNEALHLTGAFHLAGFQHVIGTLWTADDTAARALALDFYRELFDGTAGVPDLSRCARALHRATLALRRRFPALPTSWAPYTHFGP